MRMAEEFERCDNCGEGWFELKERVLVRKGSPRHGTVDFLKKEVNYVCSNCSNIQYRHFDNE